MKIKIAPLEQDATISTKVAQGIVTTTITFSLDKIVPGKKANTKIRIIKAINKYLTNLVIENESKDHRLMLDARFYYHI